MIDITYCASKTCPEQGRCGRHISNNDLKGKIYSISDFTPMNKGCEFSLNVLRKKRHIYVNIVEKNCMANHK